MMQEIPENLRHELADAQDFACKHCGLMTGYWPTIGHCSMRFVLSSQPKFKRRLEVPMPLLRHWICMYFDDNNPFGSEKPIKGFLLADKLAAYLVMENFK
jgi:hypothetical protein